MGEIEIREIAAGSDPREFIDIRFDMVPAYEEKVLSRDGDQIKMSKVEFVL